MKIAWHVDDEQEMINAIQLMMQLLDYETRPYLNARDAARDLVNGERPDLILLDINMPEVSGIDLLEFLRRKPEFESLPIVMLSSEAADVQVDEAYGLGADAYVSKPVTIEELETAIQRARQARQW